MCSSARVAATLFSEAALADSLPCRGEAAFEGAMLRLSNPGRSAERLRRTTAEANVTAKNME